MSEETTSLYVLRRRAFESVMRRRGRSDSTLKTYRHFLDQYGEWLGERDPAEVTKRVEIEEWFDVWENAYRTRYRGKSPSQNTIRNHQAALASFYDFLVRRDLCQVNPVSKLDRTKGKNKKADWLTQDEFNALLDAPATPQERIIINLYAWTAARAGDILSGVRQGDVNLDAETITIRVSKTEAGERTIPILPELRNALEDWLNYIRKLGLRDDRLPLLCTTRPGHYKDRKTGQVTHTKPGSPMKHPYAWRVLKQVAGRAGVRAQDAPDKSGGNVSTVTLHTLRRTLATHLLNGYCGREPVRVEVVQALCGHADVRTTLSYYAEVHQATMAAEIRRAVA